MAQFFKKVFDMIWEIYLPMEVVFGGSINMPVFRQINVI